MGYHIACLVRTRRRRVPLAPPVGICDGWRVGEVPERPKGHAWRACVPTRYRGFESLPLRSKIRGVTRASSLASPFRPHRMPTDPLPQLLDRDLAKADVREWIDVAVPLLQEVVNYG